MSPEGIQWTETIGSAPGAGELNEVAKHHYSKSRDVRGRDKWECHNQNVEFHA